MREGVLLAAVLLVAAVVVTGVRLRSPEPGPHEAEERPGTLTVLRLLGSPREKGLTHGRVLKEAIGDWLSALRPADPGVAEFALQTCGDLFLPQIPAPMREELEGLAEGAGITLHEALYLNTRFELADFRLVGRGEEPPRFGGAAAARAGPALRRDFLAADLRNRVEDLVVVVHLDLDPALVMVALPGMVGGLLGVRGETCAALRPRPTGTTPVLSGLAWPLLVRELLERPPEPGRALPAKVTRPASLPMVLPGGSVGTLVVAPSGASWYPAREGTAYALFEPVTSGGLVTTERLRETEALSPGERSAQVAGIPADPMPRSVVAVRLEGGGGEVRVSVRGGGRRLGAVVRFDR